MTSKDDGGGTGQRKTLQGQTPNELELQEEGRESGVPIPSPPAAALRLQAALRERLDELSLQSARLSDAEKLTEFRQHLAGLRWKRFHCCESPAQHRERMERLRQELGDRARRPRKPTWRVNADGSLTRIELPQEPLKHEDEPAVDPCTETVLAYERDASHEWRKAHAAMWMDFTLPLAQSARDVAEIAQREKRNANEVREADELAHALLKRPLSAPSEGTMELAESVVLLVDQLARGTAGGIDERSSDRAAQAGMRAQEPVAESSSNPQEVDGGAEDADERGEAEAGSATPASSPLGDGGPAKTLDAVCRATAHVPELMVGQMPARVLVTLLENGGSMSRLELRKKHSGPAAKADPRLANLLTPRGELSKRGFIESREHTVALSDAGRQEAADQRRLGTKAFEEPDSRSTHDDSR